MDNHNNIQYKDPKSLFIKFLLYNRNLTRFQRAEISKLIEKDYEDIVSTIGKKEAQKIKEGMASLPVFKPLFSNDKPIFRFLHQFAEANALKFTTHTWEKDAETQKYPYKDFDDFKTKYIPYIEKWGNEIVKLDKELWWCVNNFLLNEDPNFHWGEHEIRVGYNKYLKLWMDNNPSEQPFAMPLSEFPEDYVPAPIGRKVLSNFNDVVNLFKQCIEFRDNTLYDVVRKQFKGKNVNKEMLATLQGITFYTDTWKVKEAIRLIAGNMRSEFDEFEISCITENKKEAKTIKLEILQVGSFSNRDITDDKITALDKDCTMASLQTKLRNLCSLAVESTFKVNGEIKPLHINYLTTDKKAPAMLELGSNQCRGFKYILTFNIYNNE